MKSTGTPPGPDPRQVQASDLKAKASALRAEAEAALRQLREVLVSVQRGLDQETTSRR